MSYSQFTQCSVCGEIDWREATACKKCGASVLRIDSLCRLGPIDRATDLRRKMFPHPYSEIRGLTGIIGHYEREQRNWNRQELASVRISEYADAESIESAARYFDDLAA